MTVKFLVLCTLALPQRRGADLAWGVPLCSAEPNKGGDTKNVPLIIPNMPEFCWAPMRAARLGLAVGPVAMAAAARGPVLPLAPAAAVPHRMTPGAQLVDFVPGTLQFYT